MIGIPTLRTLDEQAGFRVWFATHPIDMRLGFDRLMELAQRVTGRCVTGQSVTGQAVISASAGVASPGADHTCTHLFVFRSRGGDRLKMLYWDQGGLVLWYKRLEEGVFKWPTRPADQTSVQLRWSELAMLLDGIDLKSLKRARRYKMKA